jgi:hypothetical protein
MIDVVNRQVGDVSVSGEPTSNVIALAFKPKQTDGGKQRILRRRALLSDGIDSLDLVTGAFPAPRFKFRIPSVPVRDNCEDMMMDHADPCNMPSDSPYHAPDHDCA